MSTRVNPICIKDQFYLPGAEHGGVYMGGLSVGPMSRNAEAAALNAINDWKTKGVKVWGTEEWIDAHKNLGRLVSPFIGAKPEEVVVSDHASANLFKLMLTGTSLTPGRRKIITDCDDFPADRYAAQNVVRITQKHEVVALPYEQIFDAIDEDTAFVSLSQTGFRNSAVRDMKGITDRAHEKGAMVLWDLSHSVGVMPIHLDEMGVDFAVGCTYKYLNGGPGNMSFAYINEKHFGFEPQMFGWLGHAAPFAFEDQYRPAPNAESFHIGTQPVMLMRTLEGSLKDFEGHDMAEMYAMTQQLTGELIERIPGIIPGSECLTPTDPNKRGGHVAIWHENGDAIVRALNGHSHLVCDFRKYPKGGDKSYVGNGGICRFNMHPLYTSFGDTALACDLLEEVVREKIYERPEYAGPRTTKVS